ncbi:Putative MFS transporter superfamily [Septoria linicola]|uniref:MFS transporter superfamily n=1 Tax=Septoria linicola TaxID=215465 RepID=A0A9Q9ASX6_9PEZI|nr:putative MFS transporter superfamily [Septoria linicola]USW51381.1 Putative MFS transporter superfamily [Septoria linicola]
MNASRDNLECEAEGDRELQTHAAHHVNHDVEKVSIDERSSPSSDGYEVYWDEPINEDPTNPMNWTSLRKISIIAMVSFVSFLTPLAYSMFAPGVPEVMADFDSSSNILSTFVVSVHWILPQIGTAITGFGMIVVLFCIQAYLVDTYTVHAASAIAANTVLRSLLGALLPLCGLEVYAALGSGWGNSLLGFLALGLAPIPVLFGVFGERLRKKQGLVV